MTPDRERIEAKLRRAVNAHAAAVKRADEAREARDAVVREALDAGMSERAVSTSTGISPARIHQIQHRTR